MYKHLIFRVISIWVVLTQTLPPINYVFPFSNSLKFTIFICVSILSFPKLFGKSSIVAFFLYFITVLVYYLRGNQFFETINSVITVPLVMLTGLLITEYTLKYDYKYEFTKVLIICMIGANVIMSLLSLSPLAIDPNIIRKTSYIQQQFGEDVDFSYWIISYQTVHGLPLLFPPLAFYIRKLFRSRKELFIIWGGVTIILVYIVFRSNAATATLFSFAFLAVGFLISQSQFDKKLVTKLTIFALLGILLVQPTIISPILDSLQGTMDPSGESYKRIGEVKTELIYGEAEGDWAKRQDLYETSKKLFLESPLIGTNRPDLISRHTWLIDRLALFGIIFILPLVLLFMNNIRSVFRNLLLTKVVYMCGIACLVFLLYMKNDFAQGTWLYGFTYLPLLCRYVDYELMWKEKNRKSLSKRKRK